MRIDWTDGQQDARRALAQLASDEARIHPSPALASRVLAAWDRAHVPARRPNGQWQGWWPMAAGVALSVLALQGLATRDPSPPLARWQSVPRWAPSGNFTPATFVVGQQADLASRVTVVRVQVPVEYLVTLGLTPSDDQQATATLELLVGEDGVARTARVSR
jgi:hypothetical protein